MDIDEKIAAYEKRTGITLGAHQKARLRKVLKGETVEAEWDRYWEGEEARTLLDSNRYNEDAL